MVVLILAALLQFEERKLATLPEGGEAKDLKFRRDGAAVAYIFGGSAYVGDRKVAEGAKWPKWSPDGRMACQVRADKKWRLFLEGEPAAEEFDLLGSPSFSADGRTVAYLARTGKKFVMVVDGKRSPEYDEISLVSGFDDTGRTLYYAARDGAAWTVVVGDRTYGPFDSVALRALSADGSVCAVVVGKEGKSRVLVGERTSDAFDEILLPALSRDGRVLAFTAKENGKEVVVLGGRKIQTDLTLVVDLTLSEEGKHVAYGGDGTERLVVGVDERRIELKDAFMCRYLTFRPGHAEVAFAFNRGLNRQGVWAGGEEGETFASVRGLKWSPDGKVAYVGRRASKKEVVVVGSKAGPECDFVEGFQFSPKGVLVSVVQRGGRYHLRLGDRESEGFDRIERPLRFSEDGSRVGFGAAAGRELWWKVLNVP